MPQDQDDIKGADAMKQAPTPGPLSGDALKLLVKGDLLLLEGKPVRFINLFMGGIRADDGSEKRISALPVERFAFIGRPDADGWIAWSGGENPVPGQIAETKHRDGIVYEGSEAWPSDEWFDGPGFWVHDGSDSDIIAFRLAPPAPVEDVSTKSPETNTSAERVKETAENEHVAAPVEASGSVGLAANEIGAHIAKRDAEYEAALADLTIKPDASSLEEFGRSIFGALSDCPAMSIDKQADFVARALWPALSTTPARAEAQDEGAAGEPFEPTEHPLYIVSEAARRQLVRAAGWIEKEAYDASGHDDPEDEGLDEAARFLREVFNLSDDGIGR